MKTFKNNLTAFLLSGATMFLALVLFVRVPSPVSGSVNQYNEYHSTTTSTGRFGTLVNLTSSTTQTQGALGSVIITGPASGVINIYDATTTNVNLRTGGTATSSILLATFPATQATTTFTFDALYYNGLIVETIGTMPTTTITYR